MKAAALCVTLLMLNSFTLKSDAAFLRITPDRLQHFQFDSVSFDCGSNKVRVTRENKESDPQCDNQTPTGSSCTIERVYLTDSGEYWCESGGRDRSNGVNVTVTAGSVILESPVLPVAEGETVTLHCRNKSTSTNRSADFYKDGLLLQESSPAAEITISNVSKSDEGLYKCNMSGAGESAESWLAVRARTVSVTPPPPPQEPPSEDSNAPRSLIVLWMTITIVMLALVLVVVGLLFIRKHRVSSKKPKATTSSVCDEDTADDRDGVTYAVVVPKPRETKDAADAADNLSLGSNHSRKPLTKDESELSSIKTSSPTETPSPTETSSPTAAKDSSSPEQELLYAPVLKATKSKDS